MSVSRRSTGFLPVVLATTMAVLAGCGALGARPGLPGSRGFQAMTFANTEEVKEAVLHYGDRDRLTKVVNSGMDIWSVDIKKKRAKGTLNEAQARVAEGLGMQVDWAARQTVFRADAAYRNYDQINTRLKELVAMHPEFAELVDIGDSWETTKGLARREILALRLGKGSGKPVVTFAGCHHARELATPEMVLKMCEHLVTNYGTDAEVTAAIDNREIWLVPLVNPDAHTRAVKGTDWRKNANNDTGGKRRIGVDLNRNYDIAWGTVGDSGNPEADTFRGAKAFSEPETQAVRDLLIKHPPKIYLTFHSFSNCVMWSWDHKDTPPGDPRLAALGTQLGKLSGYDAYQGCEMYLNSGDDIDWAFSKLGSLAYTVEIGTWGDGFMPPYSKIAKFWDENRPMMLHALKVADNPGAVFGPNVKASVIGNQLAIDAKGATRVEMFLGTPGYSGKGSPMTLQGQRAMAPLGSGPRQLVYVHALGANGTWGPWNVAWTK